METKTTSITLAIIFLIFIGAFVLIYAGLSNVNPLKKDCTYKDYNFSNQTDYCGAFTEFLKQANINMQEELKQKDEEIANLKPWKWSAIVSFTVALIALITMILRSRKF